VVLQLEAHKKTSIFQNVTQGIGTWNVRSQQRSHSLEKIVKDLVKYKLDLVGVAE
jgi:hypothetical protein